MFNLQTLDNCLKAKFSETNALAYFVRAAMTKKKKKKKKFMRLVPGLAMKRFCNCHCSNFFPTVIRHNDAKLLSMDPLAPVL